MSAPGMVIIGAGEAGARAAMALRENRYEGPVTLVGAEVHLPYERPPLSKSAMTDADPPAAATIVAEAKLAQHDVAHVAGRHAVAIDRAARVVTLDDGTTLPYAKLLLATGARPRPLSLPGTGPENVLYLRTFGDALAMRARLVPHGRIVVIGGGFIGLEIASSAIARGCRVNLVEMGQRLLMRGVPEAVAALVQARHERAGVTFHLGASIARVERDGSAETLVLADGTRLPCDAIVAGIGAVPETALAEAAGLAIDNGVAADAGLRTSDPDIYAAGDCCSFPHGLYAARRLRLEAWRNAQDQGNLAARNMLGGHEAYAAVPWFWSDQYDETLQIAGLPDEGRETVVRDLGEGAKLFFHLAADGRLVAASGVGPNRLINKDIRLAEMLIGRRATPDSAALASASVKLKALLAA